ncbi:MAG TPA: CHAD domain-containing protein [Blastocatellia bacterium]|jgi:CHAD domain-containing protein
MAESEPVIVDEPAKGLPGLKSDSPREPRSIAEIIASQVDGLRKYHAAVLQTDEAEAIHKMRVTTRRLQASLDLLGRDMKVRGMKRRLRKWRRKLSLVRNYDVFLLLLEKEAASVRHASKEQFDLLKSRLKERRDQRAKEAKDYLSRINIDALVKKLGINPIPSEPEHAADADKDSMAQTQPLVIEEGAMAEPESPSSESDAPTKAAATLPVEEKKLAGHIADRLEQRLAEFQLLASQSHPKTDPAELHQLRIAAKRVRYLLENVSEMGYGEAPRALSWLRNLQDRIGEWHDHVALEEEIIQIVGRQKFMRAHLAESTRMLQVATHLQNKKERLVKRLFPLKTPATLPAASRRIIRALRRKASGRKPSKRPAKKSIEALTDQ